jgi:hypothetical protein
MGEEVKRNDEYIDALIRYALLYKQKDAERNPEFVGLRHELLQMELKLSSAEILYNTKIAFPKPQNN